MEQIKTDEVGTVISIGKNVARVAGLPGVRYQEILCFEGDRRGIAFNLDRDEISVVMLDDSEGISSGQEVARSEEVLTVPAGDALLGRIIDPLGRPLDGNGDIQGDEHRQMERDAPPIIARSPVKRPLQTGIMVIDSLIPVGLGQRELILGDRKTGKTAIAVDTIINQKNSGLICIYCAIGQRNSAIARAVHDLQEKGAAERTIVVVASVNDTPGLIYTAPYAATAMAEYFMDRGDDVLLVYDDLTRHAWSYRELSLLLRRPPAREAYPGDIFYIHSRLLERATQLREDRGGGSITALPLIEVQRGDISAYIPTNLISITDGQIYLSTEMFQEGYMPAVNVGKSVSRVGGKAQIDSYKGLSGELRLSYSQFEELESFARFGTTMDEKTRNKLERGRRIRESLKQFQYYTLTAPEQISILFCLTEGLFDAVDVSDIQEAGERIQEAIRNNLPDIEQEISEGKELSEEMKKNMRDEFTKALKQLNEKKEE